MERVHHKTSTISRIYEKPLFYSVFCLRHPIYAKCVKCLYIFNAYDIRGRASDTTDGSLYRRREGVARHAFIWPICSEAEEPLCVRISLGLACIG